MDNTFGYFSKDVAIELEITTSSLRRWSIELEKEGYSFHRNDKDQRIYYERDFKALREFKKLLANSVPFSDATKAVASRDFETENAVRAPSVYSDMIRLSKRELKEIIKKEIENEREILLDAIQVKLNDTIEVRDKLLTQQLRNAFEENKKMIEVSRSSGKVSWWKKLLNNKGEN